MQHYPLTEGGITLALGRKFDYMETELEQNGDDTVFHAAAIKQSLDELVREVQKAKSSNTPLPPEVAGRLVEVCVLFTNILKTDTVKNAIKHSNSPEAIELIEEARKKPEGVRRGY